ncbi:hypothetical protein L6452_40704 [Arctium lappa]|uniref:Uncharacterized protein n=1 Tax=Arctium lappa TaxID=4217 RepID=A0ACB8XPD5_ARCLA|nr:hypothetical protein L6452_40704 [Arctium lappa]
MDQWKTKLELHQRQDHQHQQIPNSHTEHRIGTKLPYSERSLTEELEDIDECNEIIHIVWEFVWLLALHS